MHELTRTVDRWLAIPMFCVSLAFLVFVAGALHLHHENAFPPALDDCLIGLACLYPAFVLELIIHAAIRSPGWKRCLLHCLIPPLRLGARDHLTGATIWLPRLGSVMVDRPLRERVIRASNLPMIVTSLLVLPLFVAEHVWAEQIHSHPQWALGLHISEGIIWLAFTIEFTVMISLVDSKLRYCREHWLDLAIILLPLIAFLRVARATRLARLMRLEQLLAPLAKMLRVYRLRGTMLRTWKALILLNVIDRILVRSPEKRLAKLQSDYEEKARDLDELRARIASLETQLAAVQQVTEPVAMRNVA